MKTTKILPFAFLLLTTSLAACAATTEEASDPADENVASRAEAQRVGGTSGTTSSDDLRRQGYTCTKWAGTTVTECTKPNSPTYTCDAEDRCGVLRTGPVWPPIIVGPVPTLTPVNASP